MLTSGLKRKFLEPGFAPGRPAAGATTMIVHQTNGRSHSLRSQLHATLNDLTPGPFPKGKGSNQKRVGLAPRIDCSYAKPFLIVGGNGNSSDDAFGAELLEIFLAVAHHLVLAVLHGPLLDDPEDFVEMLDARLGRGKGGILREFRASDRFR